MKLQYSMAHEPLIDRSTRDALAEQMKKSRHSKNLDRRIFLG
ncbi:hypothetical protein [Cohnella rhizosphaerae]|uniref:Uncharacterized protein n=1 Tax=Cohnella rhizosphaerae TaxID=1457232 RepID=A0A9X4QRN1_9BACL|nr:hypothetical protein [Cohnella rhizosphaerae]MDG0808424.1 hypothetical protein [Cohnella rhizosphaerae]